MRNLITTILVACLAIMGLISPIQAQMANKDEALTVARNWINTIIQNKGDWGGSRIARVDEIQEFRRGERILGYFCTVKPQGFIAISLHKALAPVISYSTISNLDPKSDEGMTDVIKISIEGALNAIEQQMAPINPARAQAMENNRHAWEKLGRGIIMNYRGGKPPLLTSKWHQCYPYNDKCPSKGCKDLENCELRGRALVGCVATAAAQIMRYWCWPPGYDWPNMPNDKPSGDQIDAVAMLCSEVGKEAGMDYGCDESTALLNNLLGKDMTDAYQDHFRYKGDIDYEERWHWEFDPEGWFEIITNNLNANRPLQYAYLKLVWGEWVVAHSVVVDGWDVIGGIRYCHMNYGHGGSDDNWYPIDSVSGAESMIRKIKPAPALGDWLSKQDPDADQHVSYPVPPFPYRYFDQDSMGRNVTFEAGHYLQFLPGVKVTCTSPIGDKIQFIGWSNSNTYLFTRGDTSRGIRIHSGHIYLHRGSIKFH